MPLQHCHAKYSRWPLGAVMGALLLVAGCATGDKAGPTPGAHELAWPEPPEQPRVAFLRSISSDRDIGATERGSNRVKDALLGKTEKLRRLSKPYGVHVDEQGRILVTDTGLGKLVVFDGTNKTFSLWGEGTRGVLAKPIGVTSDSFGKVYVTDMQLKKVVVFDRDGNFFSAIGKKGELERPAGIAVDEKTGRIYVADVKKHHIAVFDTAGALISTIGTRGKAPGQFNYPTNLALNHEGKLYVVDSMNFRVQILDPEGKDRKSTRLNSSHSQQSRMPSSA